MDMLIYYGHQGAKIKMLIFVWLRRLKQYFKTYILV